MTSRLFLRSTHNLLNNASKKFYAQNAKNIGNQGGMVTDWPRRKVNTVFNICRQGELHLIEHFGKYHDTKNSGFYFAVPLVDKITVVDMREKAIAIEPQMAISRDNVSVKMSGVVYLRFVDPKKAAYGHFSPLFAVLKHSESAMRAAIGELELDSLFHDRAAINAKISTAITAAAGEWGIQVLRYEVTEIMPDHTISEAMDRQARAERIRREQVLKASGDKEAAILKSEGELQSRTNVAQATKLETELHAQGRANAVEIEAKAQANAIASIANALQTSHGEKAAKIELAKNYMQMMGAMGGSSNTIFFGEQAGDMTSMMCKVAKAFQVGTDTEKETVFLGKSKN